MTTYTLSIIVEGKDHASGPLGGLTNALSRMGQIAGGVLLAGGLSNLASGMINIGKSALGATADMQAMQVGLESLVARELRASNAQLDLNQALIQAQPIAQGLMKDLKNIAILSPFRMETVQDTFRMGMAFGFTANESKQMTAGLLNVASGVGASDEMLQRMAYNLAQVRMQGKVTAVDIRQLAMAGFDLNGVLRSMGEQFGVTINDHEDFNKALASGKIKWEDFAQSFEKYADENFGGASQRMAMTLNGLKSTFADVFMLSMPQILGPAAEEITGFLQDILGSFMDFADSGALEAFGRGLGEKVGTGIDALSKFRAELQSFSVDGTFFRTLIDGIRYTLGLFGQFWAEQGPTIMAIGQEVFGALVEVGTNLANMVLPFLVEQFQKIGAWFVENGPLISAFIQKLADGFTTIILPAIENAWGIIEPLLGGLIDLILDLAKTVMQMATGDWAGAWETIKSAVEGVVDAIGDAVAKLIEFVRDAVAAIGEFTGASAAFAPPQKQYPGYGGGVVKPKTPYPGYGPQPKAMGGTVLGGSPYLVGEQGPELFWPGRNGTIIPNRELLRNQKTVTVNVNVNVASVANGVDINNLAYAIAKKIKEAAI